MSESSTDQEPTTLNLHGKRWVFYVRESQTPDPERGYIPSIVVENEPGHWPLAGGPKELKTPWYWGDLKTAREIAARENLKMGYNQEQVQAIVDSSMLAGMRDE